LVEVEVSVTPLAAATVDVRPAAPDSELVGGVAITRARALVLSARPRQTDA